MSNKNDKLSVFISLILRHKPEAVNIKLDESGYAKVDELIKGINDTGRKIDFETLKKIVKEDKKGRYSFNHSLTLIRANQGHSVNVKVPLTEIHPPELLYHGTATKSVDSILKNGLNPMSRLHIHLSKDVETALQVGRRHGKPVLLKIDAETMWMDGHKFYLSENEVFLAYHIPSKYISKG